VQPALAGIKHCNRLEQVLARAECDRAGADEGLLRDADGYVVSATAANLFVLSGDRWLTPPVDRCGVAGTCRAALLAPLSARETSLAKEDVERADAVFLCNAVRGILPVARLGARRWPVHPGVAAAQASLARLHPGFRLDAPALGDLTTRAPNPSPGSAAAPSSSSPRCSRARSRSGHSTATRVSPILRSRAWSRGPG